MNKRLKEPVRLREKILADGNISLYLDIYYRGRRKYEFLKLYLLPEEGSDIRNIRRQNEATMRAALAIKSERVLDITTGRVDIFKKAEKMRFDDLLKDYDQGRTTESTLRVHHATLIQLVEYAGDEILLNDIDKDFVLGFLSHMKQLISNGELSDKSALVYYGTFSAVLNFAVRSGKIMKNPCQEIEKKDKIHATSEERVYLTIDEVKAIANTETKHVQAKSMFLFSCFCGLRISDVLSLRWGDIHEDTDRNGKRITRLVKLTQKTKERVSMKLSDSATMWLPEREDKSDSDLVFGYNLKNRTINNQLKAIAAEAHISKPITFHAARHTFATMMLTMGADLYTTSKLLGHTNISTTQIYAKIVDKKKDDAMDLIDGIL